MVEAIVRCQGPLRIGLIGYCWSPGVRRASEDSPVRTAEGGPSPEQLARQRAGLGGLRLGEAGQLTGATDSADRMPVLERRLFGAEHEDVAGALEFAAGYHAANDDMAGALERLARLDP